MMGLNRMKQEKKRRVVITGMGAVTPHGSDVQSTWRGIKKGENHIGYIKRFPVDTLPVRFGGEVTDPSYLSHIPADYLPYLQRASSFGFSSSVMGLNDSLLSPSRNPYPSNRCGIYIGCETERPALNTLASLYRAERDNSARSIKEDAQSEFVKNLPSTLLSLLVAYTGFRGPSLIISSACTSSSQAVGEAFDAIRRGRSDMILVCGCDSLIDPIIIAGFYLLGALSLRNEDPEHASRPFDLRRDGFVLGEGGGCVILEEYEGAIKRGARIYAEIKGYGCSSNAYRMTDSPVEGEGAYLAMKWALEDGGVAPEEIDYINAHGTSTQQNDISETNAIKRLFGKRAKDIPISSIKSMMGHLVAAGGIVELIVTVMALMDGIIPPTINYEFPDPSCDLFYVPNRAIERKVRIAMNNSFGFGGLNAVHLIEKLE